MKVRQDMIERRIQTSKFCCPLVPKFSSFTEVIAFDCFSEIGFAATVEEIWKHPQFAVEAEMIHALQVLCDVLALLFKGEFEVLQPLDIWSNFLGLWWLKEFICHLKIFQAVTTV